MMYDYTYVVQDAPSREGSTAIVTVQVRAENDQAAEEIVSRATGAGYDYVRQVDVRYVGSSPIVPRWI